MISLRSQITKTLLNYFFINPASRVYVNELYRNLKIDKRNLVRKLKELEKEGILKSETSGNLKLYSVNRNYPLYREYRKIVLKTIGFEDKLKKILEKIEGVKEAYIYGSYAKDKMAIHSDVDLLIVGNHNLVLLQGELNRLQKEIKREINVVNIDEREFKKRIKNKDPFISEILKEKHIRII
jgi:predicted nucleotidyltransferase